MVDPKFALSPIRIVTDTKRGGRIFGGVADSLQSNRVRTIRVVGGGGKLTFPGICLFG